TGMTHSRYRPQADGVNLDENSFNAAHDALVAAYDLDVPRQAYPQLRLDGASSPSNQADASGSGALYLTKNESDELNSSLPHARDMRLLAGLTMQAAPFLQLIPSLHVDAHCWGMGIHSKITGGDWLAAAIEESVAGMQMYAAWKQDQAT